MAGKKGMQGGGGARVGAGRQRKRPAKARTRDMLRLLMQIARGDLDVTETQLRAAIAAVQYTHAKAEGGQKKLKQAAAKKVVGRFAPMAPPRLVASGGKRLTKTTPT